VAGKVSNAKAPARTFEEGRYLRRLIEDRIPVRVRLADGQELEGTIEFCDTRFVRITRPSQPNLFVFKHDIKYLFEREESGIEPREIGRGEDGSGESRQ
jgi:sRNA-binding regulator protein Hfq